MVNELKYNTTVDFMCVNIPCCIYIQFVRPIDCNVKHHTV